MSISSPTDISNCLVWLSADYGTGVNQVGDGVSTWTDRSGNSNNATQATSGYCPTLQAAVFGDLPALRFDGVDDFLATPSLTLSGGDELTVALVFKPRTSPASRQIIAQVTTDTTANNAWRLSRGAGESYVSRVLWYEGSQSTNEIHGYYGIAAPYQPTTVLVRVDRSNSLATEIELYINGVLSADTYPATPANLSGNWANGPLYLGGLPPASMTSKYAGMDLAEVVYYSRRVTDTERDDLLEYLQRWDPTTATTGTAASWAVVLRGLERDWRRVYNPASPGGINDIEAIVDRNGGCVRASFTAAYGLAPDYPCIGEIWLNGQRVFMGVVVRSPARYPGSGSYELEGLRWLYDRSIVRTDWSASADPGPEVWVWCNRYGSGLISQPSALYTGNNLPAPASGSYGDQLGAVIDQVAAESGNVWGIDADGILFFRAPTATSQTISCPPGVREWVDGDYAGTVTEAIVLTEIGGTTYEIDTVTAADSYSGLQVAINLGEPSVSRTLTTTTGPTTLPLGTGGPSPSTEVVTLSSGNLTDVISASLSLTPGGPGSTGTPPTYNITYLATVGSTVVGNGSVTLSSDPVSIGLTVSTLESGSATITLTYQGIGSGGGRTPGTATITWSRINPAFTALATTTGEAALSVPVRDVSLVTVDGVGALSDQVTVLADVDPLSTTAEVTEVAYRCSTTLGTRTTYSLGAPLRPIAARQIVRLTESVISNPYRRR